MTDWELDCGSRFLRQGPLPLLETVYHALSLTPAPPQVAMVDEEDNGSGGTSEDELLWNWARDKFLDIRLQRVKQEVAIMKV